MIWVAVALAGAAGAVCRYTLDYVITARSRSVFPTGTLVVNISGSLLVGIVAGLVVHHGAPTPLRTVAAGGFCGAYTTFSTLIYESWRLLQDGSRVKACANLASLLVGAAAAAAGWCLTGA